MKHTGRRVERTNCHTLTFIRTISWVVTWWRRHIPSMGVKANKGSQRKTTATEKLAYSPRVQARVQVVKNGWNSAVEEGNARTLVGALHLLSFPHNLLQSHEGNKQDLGLLATSLVHFWRTPLSSASNSPAVQPLWSSQGNLHACGTVWVLRRCLIVTCTENGSGFHSHHGSL